MKILVVEDDETSRGFLERALGSGGYQVVSARDGAQGLELARRAPPDMIISDILMPEMDGYELCRRLKRDERLRGIPFIFYTAVFADKEGERLGDGLGASGYIAKPCDLRGLLAAVEAGLSRGAEKGPPARPPGNEEELKEEQLKALNGKLLRKVRELQEKEAALKRSEERFRSLVEKLNDWVWELDAEGRFIYSSPKCLEITGYSPEELVGRTPFDFMAPAEAARVSGFFRTTSASKKEFSRFENTTLRKGGGEVTVETSGASVTGVSGELLGWRGVNRDVTERKAAEEKLKAASAEWRNTFDSITDLIFIQDRDFRFRRLNRAACEALKAEPRELIGKKCYEVLHKSDAPFPGCPLVMTFRDGQAHTEEIFDPNIGVPLLVSTSPVFNEKREVAGAVHIARNIAERKKMEEQLRQAQKMEAVGRLAGGVAHDFNNMLTAIGAYADFLLKDLPPGGPQAADALEIKKAADRAAALTRQLLAFGRKQVLRPRILDLNAVIAGIKPMLARLLSEHIELTADLAADIGPVKADQGQLEQVIMNLAVNARDAMPKGGKLTIFTAPAALEKWMAGMSLGAPPGRYAVLSVSDTGCGMDKATLSRLFEPFFTTKEMGRGTGLGLATVHGIVKQSGGDIHVYSEPGRGTTFRIYLPVCAQAAAGAAEERAPARGPRGSAAVLIVEDEEQVRGVAARILAEHGYRIIEAATPREAIDLCERGVRFDLVLSDIIMPGMCGRELFERLSGSRPGLKAVFMSGYSGESLAKADFINGKVPFVQKPFTAESLLQEVDKAAS